MSYLEEIQAKIDRDDYSGFLVLWEEYCAGDEVDPVDLIGILKTIKESRFAARFGGYATTALHLWQQIEDEQLAFDVLRIILDLQTDNAPEVGDIAYHALEKRFGSDPHFADKIRLTGLKYRKQFQGAISNFELLSHMEPGNFVYHTGGWGTGEIVSVSLVREELVIEFECVTGNRSISFENAFRNLIAIPKNHFLSRRFGDPDKLEAEARQDPIGVIHVLISDLGPKTAAEIKDELCELVIPEADWTKWWQAARSKVKKDPTIESPESIRHPFKLRSAPLGHSDRIRNDIESATTDGETLLSIYNFLRDFPEAQKDEELKVFLKGKLSDLRAKSGLSEAHIVEAMMLENDLAGNDDASLEDLISQLDDCADVVDEMEIGAFKKRLILLLRAKRADWPQIYLQLLFTVRQSSLRDLVTTELHSEKTRGMLEETLEKLLKNPISQPQFFVWYFQKAIKDGNMLLSDQLGKERLLESMLTLLHKAESVQEYRDLTKKMYGLLTSSRYLIVRELLAKSSIEFAEEFLLLVSKCHTLTDQDVKIMHSLAEVVHPSLGTGREADQEEGPQIVWTSEEGYKKACGRLQEISEVEMVETAREIEKARELGDLRENSEYKFALEKRSRLQAELKMLSEQVKLARVITKPDIESDRVSVGCEIELQRGDGEIARYTLLGPWDADPDNNILSFQSRFAQAMNGHAVGDTFAYQDNTYTVTSIGSFLDAQVSA